MPRLVNTEIMANPLNWLIVGLMVLTGAFGLALLMADHPQS